VITSVSALNNLKYKGFRKIKIGTLLLVGVMYLLGHVNSCFDGCETSPDECLNN